MESKQFDQKLVAVLYADVAGYSRLTGEDEVGTHRTLSTYLDLFTESVREHGGKVVHYAGDAILAEFPTVSRALTCGIRVQQHLEKRNDALPEDRQVRFRIGVNLGEVIVDRGDIYGEGVNVAARLETLAKPGGICVSEAVRTALGTKLPLEYEFLGEQSVKNIKEPIRAYEARLKPDAILPPTGAGKRQSTRTKHYLGAVIIAALILGAGVVGWLKPWEAVDELAPLERAVTKSMDERSIAVLPFANVSGDPEQDYFVDGLTDDLITDLSKISGLFVIARGSAFKYKGKAAIPQEVAQELGVRYLLEGSVRRAGNQLRINAQLVDATAGTPMWADRYDGVLADVFALQDAITTKIVAALAVRLTADEEARTALKQTENPEAYDALLQGMEHYRRLNPDDFEVAVKHFRRAIEFDSEYSRAYAALAAAYWQAWKRDWQRSVAWTSNTWVRADEYLLKAMENPTTLALQVSTEMLTVNRRYEEAIAQARRAIAIDPNDARSHVTLAEALTFSGRPEEAIQHIQRAMRLDPHSPASYLFALGKAQFVLERYEDAIASLDRATRRNPDDERPYVVLTAAYGQLGRQEEARVALARLNALLPRTGLSRFTVTMLRNRWPFKHSDDMNRVKEGLRNGGVPEY